MDHQKLEKELFNILNSFRIPQQFVGRKYIIESIYLLMDLNVYRGLTTEVYPRVAKKFNSSKPKVERSIRHAIEVAWESDGEIEREKIWGKRPTNSEFLYGILNYLKYIEIVG